jgi:hypothetical protein
MSLGVGQAPSRLMLLFKNVDQVDVRCLDGVDLASIKPGAEATLRLLTFARS